MEASSKRRSFESRRLHSDSHPKPTLQRRIESIAIMLLLLTVSCASDPASPEAISKEIEKLKSPRSAERVAAIVRLGNLGEKALPAVPALLQKLSDGDEATIEQTESNGASTTKTRVNEQAAIALGKIGKPAIDPLLDYVHKGQYPAWAIQALSNMGEPAVEPLAGLAENESDDRIRGQSIEALGKIDNPRALQVVTSALRDKSVYVRQKSVDALLRSKDKSIAVVQALIDALKDQSSYISGKALEALKARTGAGNDLQFDQEKWRKWLDANKNKFS